jgi:Xaa-Pro aminopeptidase
MEGAGGIRIEDDVVVHAGRSEVLTRVKRDLIEL